MNTDSSQLELLTSQSTKHSVEVEESLARGCSSRHHALIKCYEASNLKPKPFYMQVGIDQATFSNIHSGKRFPDPDIYFTWMRVAGNLIPLRYDAFKCKQSLVPWKTDAEARIADLENEVAEKDRVIRALGELLRGQR